MSFGSIAASQLQGLIMSSGYRLAGAYHGLLTSAGASSEFSGFLPPSKSLLILGLDTLNNS